jgi:hypothetical protein
MLPLVTGLAHGDEPFNWLPAYVPAGVPLVVHLRGTDTAHEKAISLV